jgi:integrin alpha FG-GAP repeat containing protein 1
MKAFFLNSAQVKSNQSYGNVSVGPTYRFVVTSYSSDQKFVIVGSQAYQAGYLSCQLPYFYTGIGKTNNYLETFYAATAVGGARAEKMWTPIIPNSSLIVFADGSVESKWGLELFISPTQKMWMIVASVVIILVIIGTIILVLHCQEKNEDRKHRESHFDFL